MGKREEDLKDIINNKRKALPHSNLRGFIHGLALVSMATLTSRLFGTSSENKIIVGSSTPSIDSKSITSDNRGQWKVSKPNISGL